MLDINATIQVNRLNCLVTPEVKPEVKLTLYSIIVSESHKMSPFQFVIC